MDVFVPSVHRKDRLLICLSVFGKAIKILYVVIWNKALEKENPGIRRLVTVSCAGAVHLTARTRKTLKIWAKINGFQINAQNMDMPQKVITRIPAKIDLAVTDGVREEQSLPRGKDV